MTHYIHSFMLFSESFSQWIILFNAIYYVLWAPTLLYCFPQPLTNSALQKWMCCLLHHYFCLYSLSSLL